MTEEYLTEARRRLKSFAARAAAVAKTATSVTSVAAAKAAAATKAAAARTAASEAATDGPPTPADPPAPDERDEIIARLERDIEAERARNAELEGAVKALEFKLDVLERSYGKQLADARADGDDAKNELSTITTQLAEATRELQQVTAHRDRLREMISFDGRRVPPELRERRPGDEDTIARLMASPLPDARKDDAAESREPARCEAETGELLSPDLVYDPSRDGDDE